LTYTDSWDLSVHVSVSTPGFQQRVSNNRTPLHPIAINSGGKITIIFLVLQNLLTNLWCSLTGSRRQGKAQEVPAVGPFWGDSTNSGTG